MAAIIIRGKAAWLTGLASLPARASGVVRRAMACAAAAVMVCAAGAALLQLVAQMLSFSPPIAVTGITVLAAALLNSLRRQLRILKTDGRTCGSFASHVKLPSAPGSRPTADWPLGEASPGLAAIETNHVGNDESQSGASPAATAAIIEVPNL